MQQTKPEEWITGVKFKKILVCKQMYNLCGQSSWPCVISKYTHTRTAITYLTCCCGPVTTPALCAVPLGANMLPDGRPLSGKLTWVQRDWFCRELAWRKTGVVPLTWLLFNDKRSYHYGSVAVSLSRWPKGRRRRWLDVFVGNST